MFHTEILELIYLMYDSICTLILIERLIGFVDQIGWPNCIYLFLRPFHPFRPPPHSNHCNSRCCRAMGQKNSRSTTPSPQAPNSLSRGYSQTNSQGQYPGTTQPNPSRGSATQNRQQMFVVTVPHGVRPGQRFAVLVNGQRHEVVCPQTAREGSQIHLSFPSTGGGPTQ